MNRKFLVLICLMLLESCDKQEAKVNCSSESANKLISEEITKEVENKLADQKYTNTGEYILDKSKIRASLEQIKIVVESIRTTKEDPNSTKKFCSSILKVTIPNNMLTDAEKTKELLNKPKISDNARHLNIDNDINVFTKNDFEYSVQPTDDGKGLYVGSENTLAWIDLLQDITFSALYKPILEVEKAEEELLNTQKLKEEAVEEEAQKLEAKKLIALQNQKESEILKEELIDKQKAMASEHIPATINTPDKPEENNSLKLINQMINLAIENGNSNYESEMQSFINKADIPKPNKYKNDLARKKNEQGLEFFKNNQINEAVKLFNEAVQIDNTDPEILNNLGFSLISIGDVNLAEKVILNTLIISPNRKNAWQNLGDIYGIKNDVNKAVASYKNMFIFSKDRDKTYKAMQRLNEKEPMSPLSKNREVAMNWAYTTLIINLGG